MKSMNYLRFRAAFGTRPSFSPSYLYVLFYHLPSVINSSGANPCSVLLWLNWELGASRWAVESVPCTHKLTRKPEWLSYQKKMSPFETVSSSVIWFPESCQGRSYEVSFNVTICIIKKGKIN